MPVAVVRVARLGPGVGLLHDRVPHGGPDADGLGLRRSGPQQVDQVSKAHMAARQLARKHVRDQLVGDDAPRRHHRRRDTANCRRVTKSSSAPCGATGSVASRTSTPFPPRGPRCDSDEPAGARAPTPSTSGPRCARAAESLAAAAPPSHGAAASPRTSRSTRRSCSTPRAGSRSTSSAASPWSRCPSACGTGAWGDLTGLRCPQRRRRPGGRRNACRVRQGARARRRRRACRRRGPHAPHRGRTGRHGGAAGGRQGRPRQGRGRGDALRLGPLRPRLHAVAARGLDARRPRVRCLLRLRAPPHGRHRDEAVDAERRADQLHRGHVLCPRVGHGEDAANPRSRPAETGSWR